MIEIMALVGCLLLMNITLLMFIKKLWCFLSIKGRGMGIFSFILWLNLNYMFLSYILWQEDYFWAYWSFAPIITFAVIAYAFWCAEKDIKSSYPQQEREIDIVRELKKYSMVMSAVMAIYNIVLWP